MPKTDGLVFGWNPVLRMYYVACWSSPPPGCSEPVYTHAYMSRQFAEARAFYQLHRDVAYAYITPEVRQHMTTAVAAMEAVC